MRRWAEQAERAGAAALEQRLAGRAQPELECVKISELGRLLAGCAEPPESSEPMGTAGEEVVGREEPPAAAWQKSAHGERAREQREGLGPLQEP